MESISTLWLSLLLFILILASAFFSSAETSMMAINRYRVKSLSAKNNKKAKRVERLLDNVDNLIGAILLGNNFVNILAASISTVIAIRIWGNGGIIFASILLTLIILIFAENTPKTFAAKRPEKIALPSAIFIEIFIYIFMPIVWLISKISKFILKPFSLNKGDGQSMNIDELKMAVLDTKSASNNYQQMLLNIIDLKKIKVDDIMIPSKSIVSFDINNEKELLKQLKHNQYTRLLMFEKQENNIIGILHMRDIVNLYAKNNISMDNIKKYIRKPYFIPEGTKISLQLEHFKKLKKRLGIVVNEYGETRGVLTIEDILEEIVGQFTPVQTKTDLLYQEDGSYIVDPKISIRDLNTALEIQLKYDEANTLNGLILEQLQTMPKYNLSVKIEQLIIEILKVSRKGIRLVRITKIQNQSNSDTLPNSKDL